MKLSILNYKKCLLICGSFLSMTSNINAAAAPSNTPAQSTAAPTAPDCQSLNSQIANVQEESSISLFTAMVVGNLDELTAAIKSGANANGINKRGGPGHCYAPLHFAVENGLLGAMKLLIENRADVNSIVQVGFSGGKRKSDL